MGSFSIQFRKSHHNIIFGCPSTFQVIVMANTYTSSSLDSSLNKAKSCFRAVLLAANDTACEPVDVTTDVFAGSLQIEKSFNF